VKPPSVGGAQTRHDLVPESRDSYFGSNGHDASVRRPPNELTLFGGSTTTATGTLNPNGGCLDLGATLSGFTCGP
jgi:hypothetical protein